MNRLKFDLDQCSHGNSPKIRHLSGSIYPLKTQCLDMKLRSRERGVRRQEVFSSESVPCLSKKIWLGVEVSVLSTFPHETSQSFSCMEGTLATRRLWSSSASSASTSHMYVLYI